MKFISWNVNGFRACLGKGFADFFAEQNADFFSIQETKMQAGQAEFETDGYVQFWNSAEKKGYSGTAVFSKKEPISVRYGLGIDEHDHEGRIITLEYENFYLLCEELFTGLHNLYFITEEKSVTLAYFCKTCFFIIIHYYSDKVTFTDI